MAVFEYTHVRVQGFDEYMNLVLDEAEEVSMKRKSRKPLGAPALHRLPAATTCLHQSVLSVSLLLHRPDPAEGRQHHAHADHVRPLPCS